MGTLWDTIVSDFTKRDTSRSRIVSRSARRLQSLGYSIPSIIVLEHAITDFDWGTKSRGIRKKMVWRLELIQQTETKTSHHGHIDVTEIIEEFHPMVAIDRQSCPEWTCRHIFAPDSKATERRLRKQGDLETHTVAGKASSLLVVNRIPRRTTRKK